MKAVERKLFAKNERLCLQKDINRLFAAGKTFVSYPLRIIYLPVSTADSAASGLSILVSVPKKRMKHAVKRNRIKRLIRESFRLVKSESTSCIEQKGKQLHIAFIYMRDEMTPFADMEKSVRKALEMIKVRCAQHF